MSAVYELSVWVADDDGDHTYEVEHRFAMLPDAETMVALKDEAVGVFEMLHPLSEVRQLNVGCRYLEASEREDGDRERVGS